MEVQNAKILIASESKEERCRLADALSGHGYKNIKEAENGEEALALISTVGTDAVICDLWLSKLDGIGLIRAAASVMGDNTPAFILLSPVCTSFA